MPLNPYGSDASTSLFRPISGSGSGSAVRNNLASSVASITSSTTLAKCNTHAYSFAQNLSILDDYVAEASEICAAARLADDTNTDRHLELVSSSIMKVMGFLRDPELAQDICGVCRHSTPNEDGTLGTGSVRFRKIPFDAAEEEPIFSFAGKRYLLTYARPERSPEEELRDLTAKLELCAKEAANIGLLQCKNAQMALGLAHENIRGAAGFFTRIAYALIPLRKWIYLPFYERTRSSTARLEKLSRGLILKKDYSLLADGEKARVEFGDSLLSGREIAAIRATSLQIANDIGNLRRINVFDQNEPENEPIVLPSEEGGYPAFLQKLGSVDGRGRTAKFTDKLILTPTSRESLRRICQRFADPVDMDGLLQVLCGDPPGTDATKNALRQYNSRISAFASLAASCHSDLPDYLFRSGGLPKYLVEIPSEGGKVSELFTAACSSAGESAGIAGRSEALRISSQNALSHDELAALDIIVRDPTRRAGTAILNFPSYKFAQHGDSSPSACVRDFRTRSDAYLSDQKAVEVFGVIIQSNPAIRKKAQKMALKLLEQKFAEVRDNAEACGLAMEHIFALQRIMAVTLQAERQSRGSGASATGAEEEKLLHLVQALHEHISGRWVSNPSSVNDREICVFCQAARICEVTFGKKTSSNGAALLAYLATNPNCGFMELGRLSPAGAASPADMLGGCRGGEEVVSFIVAKGKNLLGEENANRDRLIADLTSALKIISLDFRYDFANGIIVDDGTGRPIGRRGVKPPIWSKLVIDEGHERVESTDSTELVRVDGCVHVNSETHETVRIDPSTGKQQTLLAVGGEMKFSFLADFVLFRDGDGCHAFHHSDLRQEVFTIQNVENEWKIFLPVPEHRELIFVPARNARMKVGHLAVFDEQNKPDMIIPLFNNRTDQQQQLRSQSIDGKSVLVEHIHGAETGLHAIPTPSFLIGNLFPYSDFGYFSEIGGKVIVAKIVGKEVFRFDRESRKLIVAPHEKTHADYIANVSLMNAIIDACRADNPVMPTEEQIEFLCEFMQSWSDRADDETVRESIIRATCGIMLLLNAKNASELSIKSRNLLVKSLQKVVARFPLSPIEMTTVHTLTETLYSLHKNKVDNEVGDTDLSFETMRHNFDIEADALYKSLWGMWQTALPDDKEAILQAAMAMASLAAACVAPNEQKQWNQRCEDIKKQKAVQNLTALEISTKKRRSSDVAPAAAPVLVKFGAVAGFHGTDLVNEEKVDGSDINMAAVGYGPLCTLVDIESLQDVIDAEAPSTESEAGTVAAAEAATDLKTALQQYRERERASKVLHADLFQGRMTELAANFELMEARLLTAKQSLAAQVGDVHEICDALDRKITEFMLDLPDETVKQKRILGQLDNPTRDAVLWLWFHSLERGEDGKFAINRARFYDEYRRRYDDSLTNPSQVDVLITAAQNFLIAKTNCDAADARLAAFVRFETRARAHMRAGGRDLGLIQEAFGEFVQTLAAARTFDPNENLFTLWFEYAAGMRLLPGKKAILDGIEKRFAGERTNYTDTEIGVIIQLMMGGGKTSVVISQAIALLSGKGRVALVVNDASQHNTMCNTLKILQEERFDQGFREIPYDINEVRKIAALRDLRDTIYSARQNGSGVAAMSVTIRAVLVQLWQSIAHTQRLERRISELERTMPPNKGELQKLRAQLKAYEERLSLCREIVTGIHGFCIQIGDECHLNWDPLISVNVSEGTKQKFTTAQGKGICEFFATYDNWTTNSSIGKEAVLRIQSGQRPLRRHMENFAEAQLRRLGMWAQESSSRADFQNKARVAFLLGKCDGLEDDGSTRTGFQLDRKTVLEQFSNDEAAREQFLLCVAQMQTFYATSLKKFMEDFGLCRKNGKVTVSPYRAANTPSPGQFANPLENANATFLTYLRLRKADAPAHHLSLFHEQVSRSVADVSAGRAPKVRAFLETKYERLMGRIFDSNGSTTDRKAAENELVAALAATRDGSLVDYLELVFAMNADDQLSFPSSRWECTSFSQTALSPCIGSTGTPFNVSNQGQQFSGHQSIDETTPLCIASKAEKDLREGKSVLFELRSRDPESLAPVSVADLFTAQQNAANKKPQKVRALMDAAGLFKHLSNEDVARQMLEQCDPQVQRCVFYHDGFWIAVGRDGSRIRLSDTSEKAVRKDAGLSREEIAVFYDQAHCTGTDFKIALDAHGTVTVHRQTPISDLNQAILRERQFLSTQRVDVCAVDMDIFADKGSLASANEMADRYIALVQSAGENEEKKVGEKKFECYKKEARSAMLRIVQEKYFELSAQRDQLVRKGPAMRTLYRRRIIRLGEEIRQTATCIEKLALVETPFDLMALYGGGSEVCSAAEAFKTDLDQLQREVRNVMDPSTYAVHLEKRVAEWRATFEKSKAPFLERIGNVSLSTSVVDFGSEVEAETETETETETMSIAHAAADSTAALQNAKPCENQRPEKPYRKGREIPILKFARKILDQNEAAVLKKAAAAGLRSARRALAIYKKLKYAVNPVTWTTIRGKETTLPVFQKYAVRAIEVAANRCQLSAADLEVSAQKFLADLMEAVPSAAHSAQTAPTFWDALQERIAGTSDRHLAEIIFPDGEVGESVLSDHEWSICENALSVLQPPDTQAPLFSALRQLTAPREFAKAFLIFARMVQGDTFPPKIANQFRKADSQLPIPQEEEGAPDDVAAAAADDSTAGKKPILDLLALVSQPPREMLAMAMEKLPTDVFSILRAKPVLGALDGFVKILDTRNAVNLKTIASLGASSILGFFRSSGSRTNLVQEILNILTSMKVPQTLNAKQREQLCVWAEKELPNALVASNLLSQADAQLAGCIFSLAIEKFFSVNGELVRQIAVAQEEFTKMAVFMEGGARQVEMFDLDTAIDLNLSMVESLQSHLRAVDHTDQAMADAVSAKRTKFERVKLALSQGEESEAIVEARRNVEHAKGWLERVFASNNRSQLAKDFLSTKMPRPSCLRARLYNQRRIMMVDFLKELYGPLDIDDNGEIHYCAEVDKYSRPSVSQVFDALTAYKRDLRLREKILDGRESIQSSDQIDEIRNREQIIMNIQLLFRETTNEVEGFPMEIWGPSSDDYFLLDTQLDLVLDAEDELGNELTKMRNKSPKAQAYIEKMSDASGGFDEAKCVAQVRASLESRNKVISMARHLLIEPIISALKKATALTALKAAKPLSSAVVRYGRDGKVQLIDSVPPMPLVRWAAETSDAPENVLGYSSLFPQNVEVTQQFMEVLEAFDSAGRPNQSGNLTLRDPFSPYARHADGMFVYKAANDEIKVRLLSDQEFAGYMELQKAGHFADGYLFHGNGRLVNGCTPPLDASLETLSQEEIMANQSLIEAKALRRRILEETSKAARSAAQLLRILNGEPTLDDLEAIFVPGRLNSEAIEPTISLIQTLVRQKTGREEIPGVDWNALRRSTLGSVSMAA